MHFGELRYRHSFNPIFGGNKYAFHLQLISSLDIIIPTQSCSKQWSLFTLAIWQCLQLHPLVVFFMIIFCSYLLGHSLVWRILQSFTSSFQHYFHLFFYQGSFWKFGCAWIPHRALFSETQIYFLQQFLVFSYSLSLSYGGVRVIRYFLINSSFVKLNFRLLIINYFINYYDVTQVRTFQGFDLLYKDDFFL